MGSIKIQRQKKLESRGVAPLFFLCYNTYSVHTIMDKERLKLIVRNLELLVDGLKAEVYSDPSAYIDKRENFDDPPHYYGDYDEVFNDDSDW